MAFYIHIGCTLDGNTKSNAFIDKWIHRIPLWRRVEIMIRVVEL